jgi:hypothetical protein
MSGLVSGLVGIQTQAAQPCYMHVGSGTGSNVTGDGTDYTLVCATEITDQNGDFDGTTVTAPVTGNYSHQVNCHFSGVSSMESIVCRIVTSNRHYNNLVFDATTIGTDSVQGGISFMVGVDAADMDSGDTLVVIVDIAGGAQTADVDLSLIHSGGHLVA